MPARDGEAIPSGSTPPDRPVTSVRERLLILFFAVVLDAVMGEPPAAFHPVVGIGRLARGLERRLPVSPPGRALLAGAFLTSVVAGLAGAAGLVGESLLQRLPPVIRLPAQSLLLKPTFAVRELLAASARVRRCLAQGDLPGARAAVRHLVSRDPTALDVPLLAAATIESLAENASDSAIGLWLAYLIGGLPGAAVYRAVNTLDAMVGYRGRYEYLGRSAARLDDLLNLLPSRLTAGLLILGAAVDGADWRGAAVTAWRDHSQTASPNAGWPMSAMAGALGVELEKVGQYRLGQGYRRPTPEDVIRAERLVVRALFLGLLLLVLAAGRSAPLIWMIRRSSP